MSVGAAWSGPCHPSPRAAAQAVVTVVFAALGFLSPANRGGLMTAMLLLFVFMGLLGGYAAARMYKTFKVGLAKGRSKRPEIRPSA